MSIHLLPLFIPLLFLLVYLEWRHDVNERKETGQSNFDFQSSLTNISFGMIERIFDVFFFLGLIAVFNYIQSAVGLFDIQINHVFAWISCFFLLDFIIYWFHRSGHTINLLWGAHVTHHQCEQFNLTVAFRNSIFPHIFRSFYMLILPILGFPGEMIIICLTVSGIWQFCIHTKHINKLGILEKFMMTPSHHRVHHGKNPIYIDKNFGGFFIIWDRIFGTFQEEIGEVEFGITSYVQHNNALIAMTHVWKDIAHISSQKKNIFSAIKLWFQSPYRFYTDIEEQLNLTTKEVKKKQAVSARTKKYQFFHIVIIAFLLMHLLVFIEFYNPVEKFFSMSFIVFSVLNVSLLYAQNSLVQSLEKYRLLGFILIPLLLQSGILFIIGGVIVLCSIRRELISYTPLQQAQA